MIASQTAVTVIKLDTSSVPAAAAQAGKAIGGIGQQAQVSARQTANAMRQLPAQFTDIATQIAGGQNIGLILLQQGGQIRDSFGSIRGAVSGIASVLPAARLALLGAAGAATALATAYAAASREQDAIVRALVLSGNAAGVTADQVNELARAQAALAGTRGEATSVLTTLASSGVVAAAQLAGATDAAIRLQRAGGPAIEDTVRKFIALGRDPVGALVQLNKEENFLTESVYRQVRALKDQKRDFEAAAVAQEAYTSATLSRAAELETHLGSIQRLLRGINDIAGEAWAALFPPDTLEQQLESAIKQIEAIGDEPRRGTDPRQGEARRAAIRQRIDDLRLQIYLEREVAAANMAASQRTNAAVETDEERRRKADQASRELDKRDRERARLTSEQAQAAYRVEQAMQSAFAANERSLESAVNQGMADAERDLFGSAVGDLDRNAAQQKLLDELVLNNRRTNIALIRDDRERARATIDLDRELAQQRIDALFEFGGDSSALEAAADQARDIAIKQLDVVDDVAQRVRDNVQDAFGDIFTSVFEGQFDNIGNLFSRLLSRMVAEAASADLTYWLFGKGQGGNLAGIFGNIASAFFPAAPGLQNIPVLPGEFGGFRANGGDVQPRRAYMVGERGPEMLLMGGRGGHILSNAQMSGGGGRGVTVVNHNNIRIDSSTDRGQVIQLVSKGVAEGQKATMQALKAGGIV